MMQHNTGWSVYVKGYPEKTSRQQLQSLFDRFGTIKDIRMIKDFSFVSYANPQSAKAAVQQLNQTRFKSSNLLVQLPAGKQNRRNQPRSQIRSKPSDKCNKCGAQGHWYGICYILIRARQCPNNVSQYQARDRRYPAEGGREQRRRKSQRERSRQRYRQRSRQRERRRSGSRERNRKWGQVEERRRRDSPVGQGKQGKVEEARRRSQSPISKSSSRSSSSSSSSSYSSSSSPSRSSRHSQSSASSRSNSSRSRS